MSGPPVDVHISAEAVKAHPASLDLATPESTVRSYLDWVTYSYRTARSDTASSTMSPKEGVRVDAYIQYNIEKQRLLDQKLTSITFGKPSINGTTALVPAQENWTYSYLSINTGNGVIGGPYSASYDSTYPVLKAKDGTWRVDSVKATPKGDVK